MNGQLIYESKKSKIFFRDDPELGKPVAVKILNYEFPSPGEIAQFFNEYDIVSSLDLPGVRKVLKKGKEKNRHAIFLEWIEGENLKQSFQGKQKDIVDFLHIGIAIAEALNNLHACNVIHKDINPNNIIINLQKRKVWIIDFGISTNLDLTSQYAGNPERLEGTLAYLSPEQTGRMNRIVDYRTDLYSLGITFYELLTRQVPFKTNDAIELVHAHIAQIPELVHKINPLVPLPLSAIIAKLLAKKAEDRYQSAHGLKCDLEHCLTELQTNGEILPFALGQKDYSGKFQVTQQLYGREAEIDGIIDTFYRCAAGATELLLVAGYSGTGKSALVYEVYKPITARKGYFIGGKFDQFQRAVPYFAILEAFKELINILLTENEEKINKLKVDLLQALGEEARVITNVLPKLALILGPTAEIPEIGSAEAQNRFNYVFQKFVAVIASTDHPLVLFVDDLQWADSASLSLLQVLLCDTKLSHFLCICAYRDNEVTATHPSMLMVKEVKQFGVEVKTLVIEPLNKEDLSRLICDALSTSSSQAGELTQLVYEKTRGNAFFVLQFLKTIAEENLLKFSFESSRWYWALPKIREKNISDNVVKLMAEKTLRLPIETQEILKIGACIGNRFAQEMLSVVLKKDQLFIKKDLFPALKEGLLVPLDNGFSKFSHDRIQQAVYSLIPDAEKSKVHLNIGRILYQNGSAEQKEEQLFDIINQLNKGQYLVQENQEKKLLAQLNLEAGRKAKLNSAFQPAFEYLTKGIQCLNEKAWNEDYDLCLALHTEACELAYLNAEFDQMEGFFDQILHHSKGILERVKPYEIRILAYKAQNKLLDAILTGLEVLEQLGEKFPKKSNLLHVLHGLSSTMIRLRGKSNQYLMDLPLMEDPGKIAAMRIIAHITSSVYWAMPNLLPLLGFRMVKLSLKYGNNAVSCFAYGGYGVILCGVLGQMKKGNKYGDLALALLDKLNAKEWKAQIYVSPYALTIHWRKHVRETLRPLQDSFLIGLETGLIEFSCVNTNIYCIHSFLCGKPLVRLEEETNSYSQSYLKFKQETNYNYNEVYRQAMLNFMGQSKDPCTLTGQAYDEVSMLEQNNQRKDQTGTFFVHFLKSMLCYHFGELEMGKKHAELAAQLLDAVLAKFEIPNLHFYHSLLSLALAERTKGPSKRKFLSQANRGLNILRKFSRDAPMNFQHKADLITAEKYRVLGQLDTARLWYDKAISGAIEHEYLHEEALAYELTGPCLLLRKQAQNSPESLLYRKNPLGEPDRIAL